MEYTGRTVEKPWGYEIIWAETETYVAKILCIYTGRRLSRQYHVKKDETIRVRAGRLELTIGTDNGDQTIEMTVGEGYHIRPGTVHRMKALEFCLVDEVSTPELDDVVRLEDDYKRAE